MGNRQSEPLGVFSSEWEILDKDSWQVCSCDGFIKVPQVLSQSQAYARPPSSLPEDPVPEDPVPEDPVPVPEDPVPVPEDPVPETPPHNIGPPFPENIGPPLPEDIEPPLPENIGPETPPLPEDTQSRLSSIPEDTVPGLPLLPEKAVPELPFLSDDPNNPQAKPVPPEESVSDFVKRRVKENYVRLNNDICRQGPLHVANHLFEGGFISIQEVKYATNHFRDDSVKATRLANVFLNQDLSRHVKEILTAFEKAEVEIVTEISAEVQDLYPEAFANLSESAEAEANDHCSEAIACVSCTEELCEQNKTLEFDECVKITITELLCGENGPRAAEEYIQEVIETKKGELLLHKACHNTTDLSTFNLVLLAAGKALINFTDARVCGRTPLHVACAQLPTTRDRDESTIILQLTKITNLLKSEANTSPTDHDGNTPLHLAALRDSEAAVRLILNSNLATINKTNNLGNTALHIASKCNYFNVAKALCDRKAKATISNTAKKHRTALHQALACRHSMMADLVLKHDPESANCLDKKKMSPLHLATKRGNTRAVKQLVKKKSLVYVIDNERRTPLHYACVWGNFDLVQLLLKAHSSRKFINHRDSNGNTALHLASHHNDPKLIGLLFSNHASRKIRNEFGQTPKDVAASAGQTLPSKGIRGRLQRAMSKPSLSSAHSYGSMRSAVSVQSFASSHTFSSISSYLESSDEDERDETLYNYRTQ